MPSILPSVGTRVSKTLQAKLEYIADYNGRSVAKEINAVLTWYVRKFEEKHGTIKVELPKVAEEDTTIDDGGMSMYESKFTCPDCGNTLMVSWRWPEIIMNRPVRLVFICKHCNGEIKEIPESSTIIFSTGFNILDRHIDVYNQAVPYMAPGHICIHPGEIQHNSKSSVLAYKQGLTAGYVSA